MKNIDLLPPEYLEHEEIKARAKGWGAAAAAAVVVALLATFAFGARAASAKGRLERLSDAFAAMQESEKKVEDLKTQLGALVERNQAITSLLGQRAWCDILSDIAARVRPNGWLDHLELSKTITAAPGVAALVGAEPETVETLELGGFATDFLRLSALIASLKESPHVANVELENSQIGPAPLREPGASASEGPDAVKFSIRCELKRLGKA